MAQQIDDLGMHLHAALSDLAAAGILRRVESVFLPLESLIKASPPLSSLQTQVTALRGDIVSILMATAVKKIESDLIARIANAKNLDGWLESINRTIQGASR